MGGGTLVELKNDALGTSPAHAFGHGDTATHKMMNLHPSKVRAGDVYQWHGAWYVISRALELAEGGWAYYFAELIHGALERAVIIEGTMGVTVYRPKDEAING